MTNDTRMCVKCNQELPATTEYFYQRKLRSGNGYIFRAECKECNRKQQKIYRDANPDKMKSRHQQDWVSRSPERIMRDKERSRLRSQTTESKKSRREHYEANRDSILEWHRQYYRENPVRAKMKRDKRRARILKAAGSYTVSDIQLQHKNQKGKCWWCSKKLTKGDTHIDHRIPLSRGGSNDPSNLVLSCAFCNLSKSDKMPWEWSNRLL